MNRSVRRKLIIAGITTLMIILTVGSTFAEPSFTTECGECHDVNAAFTMSSNSTSNVTVGVPFALRINATKPTFGGTNFYLSIQAGWADNDNFNFTPIAILDNSAEDLNLANFIITHDFTFTPLSSGNYTIKAWCATSASSQYIEIPIEVHDVPDETPPIVDSPSDVVYQVATTGHNIVWTPFDEFPVEFKVRMNGTILISGGWNGESIVINVDYLGPGTYEYNLTLIDRGGNVVSDVVIVTVTGELPLPTTTTTTTATTTTGTTSTTSTTSPSTSGGNPGTPEDNDKVLTTATFSLIMLSMGIIVGMLVLLLILDQWRSRR